jgi:general secretion pathway protein D
MFTTQQHKATPTRIKGTHVLSPASLPMSQRGLAAKAPSGSLTKMLTVGPVASIKPNDSIVEVGKEFKIAIQDDRLRPEKGGFFHLQYDPNVLDLKALTDAETIQLDPADLPPSAVAEAVVAFRVGASAPRASTGGKTVTARFRAKAPGVSPIRVALMNANGDVAADAPPEGRGIVRVR